MSLQKSYAVFGLGRYGLAVALELAQAGVDVLAIDINESLVNSAASVLPLVKCADVTDPAVIKTLGIANMDVVIVAMAGDLEASVMATMLCKDAGVPTVIAQCATDMGQRILSRIGADKVVFPETESGTRLAKNLLSAGFVDVIELSREVVMVEMDVKAEWVGKNLIDLALRRRYGINVVALRRGDDISVNIDPNKPLNEDTKLLVIANTEKFSRLK
ncbi:MAG: TrkA family potassium uptake protein [Clostridia bacterium]|nr:TrkA family potassium uptake protein [Clostridia bacterium]